MNLRKILASLANPFPDEYDEYPTPPVDSDLQQKIDAVLAPPPAPSKAKGRIIKQTRATEFDPNPHPDGGRIVKVMPRQLQKIKQAQEKFEDDGDNRQPSVEDLED